MKRFIPTRGNKQSKVNGNNTNDVQVLQDMEKIIFDLSDDNINESADSLLVYFSKETTYSFNLVICELIFSYFMSKDTCNLCFDFLKVLESKEKEILNITNEIVIEVFTGFLLNTNKQESYYLLEKLYENGIINEEVIKYTKKPYFIHISKEDNINQFEQFSSYVKGNFDELSYNNFELHKKYVKEGVNPNELAKIIRNDEIEKLQEITSQNDFDFNQKIEPSLYERCSFVNQKNVSLIEYAAFFGSIKCFRYLLMNNVKLSCTGKYAVAGGNEEIIHLCEQNHSSFEGSLNPSIEFHRNEVFNYLYENKIIEIQNLEETAKLCISYNNFEILSFLEQEGLKPNKSLIIKAIETGNLFLLQNFYEKEPIKLNMLEVLKYLHYENIEIFNYLKDNKGIKYKFKNKEGESGLLFATQKGFIEIVKLIIEHKGIHIARRSDKIKALNCASIYGRIDIAKLLLEQKGVDVNDNDDSGKRPLILAAEYGHIEMVKFLLQQNKIYINDKDGDGNTTLISASKNGNTEIVKILLEQNDINVNATDNQGNTALIYASKNGNTEIVKILCEQNDINVNAKDNDGYSAIIVASQKGHIDIVKILLEQKGIDVNSENKYGRTALMEAVYFGYVDVVQLLLEQEEIDVNARDNYGERALTIAVNRRNVEIVKILLKHKDICVNIKDGDVTVIEKASKNGYTEIVELLVDHGGALTKWDGLRGKTAITCVTERGTNAQKGVNANDKEVNGNATLSFANCEGKKDVDELHED